MSIRLQHSMNNNGVEVLKKPLLLLVDCKNSLHKRQDLEVGAGVESKTKQNK